MTHASFGKGLTGADAAAQALFEKAPGALNAAESAKLAAVLSQPGIQNDPAKWAASAQRVTRHAEANQQQPAD
jgi:membrane carboxypeptidase/penicillin-binding protein PbpC